MVGSVWRMKVSIFVQAREVGMAWKEVQETFIFVVSSSFLNQVGWIKRV